MPQVDVDIGVGIEAHDPVHIAGVESFLELACHVAQNLFVLCHAMLHSFGHPAPLPL